MGLKLLVEEQRVAMPACLVSSVAMAASSSVSASIT
jgi:hypothetical protein